MSEWTEPASPWEVLKVDGVESVISTVSRRAYSKYFLASCELDDVMQEARLLVVTNPGLRRCGYQGDLGALNRFLARKLATMGTRADERGWRRVDRAEANDDPEALDKAIQAARERLGESDDLGDYTGREIVTAMWCLLSREHEHWSSGAVGMASKVVDVGRAWDRAALSDRQAQAVVLRSVTGGSQREIGEHLGITQPRAGEHLNNGLSALTSQLSAA